METVAHDRLALIEDLRSTIRTALGRVGPDSGDPWPMLAAEVGLAGLLAPTGSGGLDLGAREAAALSSELGAAAARTPFLSHSVASVLALRSATALADPGSENPAAELLAEAAAGTVRVTLALPHCGSATVQTSPSDDRLTGEFRGVLDAPDADAVLVPVAATGSLPGSLYLLRRGSYEVREQSGLDPSRSLGHLRIQDAPAVAVATGNAAERSSDLGYRWALLALAADQVGIARHSLEVTVEYAGMRTQFGAVIGSFQAVKHRCTEVLLEIELAAALIDQAAPALEADRDRSDLVSTAFVQATTAALAATEAMIQLHGGIGFTWEHQAHRYFRRARANADLLGPLQDVRDAVARSARI